MAYVQIGLFSIGGGHASIPVAQGVVVDALGWLSPTEFTAMISISEMTPGPFALNSATYVGIKVGGMIGGLIATLGFLLPSVTLCLILYSVVRRFRKARAVDGLMQGVRPAVAGLISSAGLSIALLAIFGASTFATLKTSFSVDFVAIGIAVTAFIVSRKVKINPVLVILISGVLGAIVYSFI
jgi:chromate transporter